MKTSRIGLACFAVLLGFMAAPVARAQAFSIDITVHEDGTGTFTNTNGFSSPLASAQQPDPGPSGLPNALTFSLLNPPGLTEGDLLLFDPVTNLLSDIIRFNPAEPSPGGGVGTLVFYSAIGGGALADTGFPLALYAVQLSTIENTLGATLYTPLAGQPGFVSGAGGPITYHLFSEEIASGVPETGGTLAFMGLALIALIPLGRRRLAAR